MSDSAYKVLEKRLSRGSHLRWESEGSRCVNTSSGKGPSGRVTLSPWCCFSALYVPLISAHATWLIIILSSFCISHDSLGCQVTLNQPELALPKKKGRNHQLLRINHGKHQARCGLWNKWIWERPLSRPFCVLPAFSQWELKVQAAWDSCN